jgi:hypothetical protein
MMEHVPLGSEQKKKKTLDLKNKHMIKKQG